MEYIFLTLILASVISVGYYLVKQQGGNSQGIKEEIEKVYSEKLSMLEKENRELRTERDKLSGVRDELYKSATLYKEKNENLEKNLSEVTKKVTRFESEAAEKERHFDRKVSDLEESRKALEDEKVRIRREDEERIAREEANRDRMWNEHESACLKVMKDVCAKKSLSLTYFENSNLPSSFDGSLKPDFLLEFLSQYIIFDAKMSRSSNLQNYLKDQVKKTAQKIASSPNSDEIYSTVYFLIPTIEFPTLTQTHFFEGGYNFYVIPVEAFESIVSAYKKITEYDLADSFDPQERENIVSLIAQYDQHISRQNAINVMTSIEGLKIMQQKGTLKNDMKSEIETTKKKMRLENLKPSELKKLIANPEEQLNQIKDLISPKKAEITHSDLDNAQQSLIQD